MKIIFLIAVTSTSFAASKWECQYFDKTGSSPIGGISLESTQKTDTLSKARAEALDFAEKNAIDATEVQCLKYVEADH